MVMVDYGCFFPDGFEFYMEKKNLLRSYPHYYTCPAFEQETREPRWVKRIRVSKMVGSVVWAVSHSVNL